MTFYRFFFFPLGYNIMTELLGYHSNHMEITNISLKDKLFKSPNVFFVLFCFCFCFLFLFLFLKVLMLNMTSYIDSKNTIPLVLKKKWGWSCKEYGVRCLKKWFQWWQKQWCREAHKKFAIIISGNVKQ